MTDIKFSYIIGERKIQLTVQNASDARAGHIIDEIFNMFKGGPNRQVSGNSHRPISPQTLPVAATKKRSDDSSKPTRQTQLLNSERTLTTNLGDKLGQALEEDSNWYASGIKYKNGVPHYRCRYWCPNEECKCSSNQYILKDDKTTECHECGTILKVRPANPVHDTSTGLPFRDSYGNFFRADKEMNPEVGGK